MTTQDAWMGLLSTESPRPVNVFWGSIGRRGIYPVADDTERDVTLISWLSTNGLEAPSTDNPLYVDHKADGKLQRSTDGVNWTSFEAFSSGYDTWSAAHSSFTVGNGTVVRGYRDVGGMVLAQWILTLGSTSSVTATLNLTLPVSALVANAAIGSWFAIDTSTSTRQGGTLRTSGGGNTALLEYGSSNLVGATAPWTWATGDSISIQAAYLKA